MSANAFTPQADHRLSIQLNLNGLSFIVFSPRENYLRYWYTYPFSFAPGDYNHLAEEVDAIFSRDPFLCQRFATCDVLFDTPKYTLVPETLYQPEMAARTLQTLFSLNEMDEVACTPFSFAQAQCVYALPGVVDVTILKYQREARFSANVVPLSRFLQQQPEYSRALFYYGTSGHAHVMLMQGDQLLLCNAYEADSFTSALYYLFFALKQWQINPHGLSLYISGPIPPQGLKQVCAYFPQITVLTNEHWQLPTEALNLQYGLLGCAL